MNYYKIKAISNSLMGSFEDNGYLESNPKDSWNTIIKTPFRIGQAFDQYVTGDFNFEIVEAPIKDNLLDYIVEKYFLELNPERNLTEFELGKIEKFLPILKEYKESGKMFITRTEYKYLLEWVENFKKTRLYKLIQNPPKHIEVIFQKEIEWTYQGALCKGMMDIIVLNHKKKTIDIYDLKTTGKKNKKEFIDKALYDYRYFRQGAFYCIACQYNTMKEWQGYKVNSFSLICIPKSNNPVFTIKMPDKVLLQGLLGTWHNGKFYKSIDDLIYEIASKYPEYKSNE